MKFKALMGPAVGIGAAFSIGTAMSQTYDWEKWKKYTSVYDYGRAYTYLDIKNKLKLKATPWIYRVDKRLRDEGWNQNTPLTLFVDCKKNQTKTDGEGYVSKWFVAKGTDMQILKDVCN